MLIYVVLPEETNDRPPPLSQAPLTEFAERSWLHAAGAGLLRLDLLAIIAVIGYLVIMNLLVPNMIGGLVIEFQNRGQ